MAKQNVSKLAFRFVLITASGLFDTAFGVAWFAGSAVMGLLYSKSIPALVLFSLAVQLLALPLLAFAYREKARATNPVH